MPTKLPTKPCTDCNGTGTVPDSGVGEILGQEREKLGIPRTAVADAMEVSESYVRDLEKDGRPWSNDRVKAYQEALEKLRNGR